jgi:hypothetical protein
VYPRDAARRGREVLFNALSGRVEHASGDVDADVVPSDKGGGGLHGEPARAAAQIYEGVGGAQALPLEDLQPHASDGIEGDPSGPDRDVRRGSPDAGLVELLVRDFPAFVPLLPLGPGEPLSEPVELPGPAL